MNYCVIAALHLKTFHRVLLTFITENRHISFFFCLYFYGHSPCWSEKTFCSEDVRILRNARMKYAFFEPLPAYGKMDVNKKKIFSRQELLLKDQNCVLYNILGPI